MSKAKNKLLEYKIPLDAALSHPNFADNPKHYLVHTAHPPPPSPPIGMAQRLTDKTISTIIHHASDLICKQHLKIGLHSEMIYRKYAGQSIENPVLSGRRESEQMQLELGDRLRKRNPKRNSCLCHFPERETMMFLLQVRK